MSEEKFEQLVVDAMNPEEFDILAYVDEQPVATDTVEVYTNIKIAKELTALVGKRGEEIAKRKGNKRVDAQSLGITEADEDTEYDDEINRLVEERDKTKMVFHLKTVAPALEKSIKKHYKATTKEDWTAQRVADHEEEMYLDILMRAIDYVVVGDGREDRSEWTTKKLSAFQEKLYDQEANKLITALSMMVYAGTAFEESLTVDFS